MGDSRDTEARPRTVRLERDLERVLEDLADDFPLLRRSSTSARAVRSGCRCRAAARGSPGTALREHAFEETGADDGAAPTDGATAETTPDDDQSPGERRSRHAAEPETSHRSRAGTVDRRRRRRRTSAIAATPGPLGTVPGRRRPARYGLLVQFESRPDDSELGRLVDSTIWINDAHPAYTRAAARARRLPHRPDRCARARAARGRRADEHAFITQFLAHWGGSEIEEGRGAAASWINPSTLRPTPSLSCWRSRRTMSTRPFAAPPGSRRGSFRIRSKASRSCSAGKRAILADDMGLGKTRQAIVALRHVAPGGPTLSSARRR